MLRAYTAASPGDPDHAPHYSGGTELPFPASSAGSSPLRPNRFTPALHPPHTPPAFPGLTSESPPNDPPPGHPAKGYLRAPSFVFVLLETLTTAGFDSLCPARTSFAGAGFAPRAARASVFAVFTAGFPAFG